NASFAEEAHVRNRRIVLIAFATLVPVSAAARQTPPTPSAPSVNETQTTPPVPATVQTPPAATAPADTPGDFVPAAKNVVDFGLRGTSIDGDASRYQRYRDLRSGPFLDDARFVREHNNWLFDVAGQHVGYADQRYQGTAGRPGLFKTWGMWDQ